MSYSKQRPTYYNSTAKDQQLINCMVGQHDLVCGCEEPTAHLAFLLITKAKPTNFTPEEKQQLKKCLDIGEDPTIKEDIDTVDFGDLEKLFEEDATDQEG